MSNETTQLQKAIKIAVKDGYMEMEMKGWFVKKNKTALDPFNAYFYYSRDLNYLMPIAVKVLKELGESRDKDLLRPFLTLNKAILTLSLDSNNQYTELFEALFNAIILLENE